MVVRNPVARALLLALGFVSVGTAIAGVFIPVIPTTGPVLLAGFAFSKSSERFDRWLVNHRWFGPIIRDWRAGLGFTVRAKVIAVVAIVASFGLTLTVAITSLGGRIAMIALALAISVFVVSRPTKRPGVPGEAVPVLESGEPV